MLQSPMIRLFRPRAAAAGSSTPLGHLETQVMDILWSGGECNVREVAQQLPRQLAYTTVMTTLDRLYKKGLLNRRKSERAFFYSPQISRQQWEHKRAGDFVAAFLAGPQPAGETLISCLVDAVGTQDQALLDALERKIKIKRKELSRREKS
jgi:predicted transcriptional regulator